MYLVDEGDKIYVDNPLYNGTDGEHLFSQHIVLKEALELSNGTDAVNLMTLPEAYTEFAEVFNEAN
ncbi:hypothetical protein ACQY0O_001014 [Thecaphora frezii]